MPGRYPHKVGTDEIVASHTRCEARIHHEKVDLSLHWRTGSWEPTRIAVGGCEHTSIDAKMGRPGALQFREYLRDLHKYIDNLFFSGTVGAWPTTPYGPDRDASAMEAGSLAAHPHLQCGDSLSSIARQLGVSRQAVFVRAQWWRRRGESGLRCRARPGRLAKLALVPHKGAICTLGNDFFPLRK